MFGAYYGKMNLPIDALLMCGGYTLFDYLEDSTNKYLYSRYQTFHLWYFLFKEYGINFLANLLMRSKVTAPRVFCKKFAAIIVPDDNAGDTCGQDEVQKSLHNTNIDDINATRICKSSMLIDIVDLISVDIRDFLATFYAKTITSEHFVDEFPDYYISKAVSGKLYWTGCVVLKMQTKNANITLTPHPEDWRIVVAEKGTAGAWQYRVSVGTDSKISRSSTTCLIALVAAFNHHMKPSDTMPAWSVSFSS